MTSAVHKLLALGVVVALAVVADDASAAKKKPDAKPSPAPAPAPAPANSDDFDRNAAAQSLAGVDLGKCKATNAPRGDGHVMVTFMAVGTVSSVIVDKGPMVGTPAAKCIQKEYTKARVPAFKGGPVQVGKSFKFD